MTQKDGLPCLHLHVTLCGKDGIAHGSHANELRVSATCEMAFRLIPCQVGREKDSVTCLNLFRFA